MIDGKNSVIIRAVGDISPGDIAVDGIGVGALSKKDGCGYPFKRLDGILKGADFLICNLEGLLSERCRDEYLRFGGLPEMAQALKEAGFDIISLANNRL